MNRIDQRFRQLAHEGRAGFIAYITAGDPRPSLTVSIVRAMERGGADIIELGVPFSDPLADGIVNQRSAERALRHGVTLVTVLACVRRIRAGSAIPIILFTYLNPLFSYGFRRFAADASRAGVDGVLVLDLPPEEARGCEAQLHVHGIRSIYLVAPTTPSERLELITRRARGFIYCLSRTGVTGERRDLLSDLAARVKAIKRLTSTPVAVGFGISTPGQVKTVAGLADAVVVGSALVKEIERQGRRRDIAARIGRKVRRLAAPLRELSTQRA
jgi:tryptophan synthase alpha chain